LIAALAGMTSQEKALFAENADGDSTSPPAMMACTRENFEIVF